MFSPIPIPQPEPILQHYSTRKTHTISKDMIINLSGRRILKLLKPRETKLKVMIVDRCARWKEEHIITRRNNGQPNAILSSVYVQ